VGTVLGTCLVVLAGPLYADSYYPLRPEDPRAVCLTKDQFEVRADGVGDDANSCSRQSIAFRRPTRVGVVFVPEAATGSAGQSTSGKGFV